MAEGLAHGAAPYKPHHQRQEEKLSQEKGESSLHLFNTGKLPEKY